ncbi:MAG: hypothetical protein KGJ90_06500 [Patescibacteria group bacterium]|nr:hypothetical protein [Patescibacteria group bacterium]
MPLSMYKKEQEDLQPEPTTIRFNKPVVIHEGTKNLKTIIFSLVFPDGSAGAFTINKVSSKPWIPWQEIEEVTFKWKKLQN